MVINPNGTVALFLFFNNILKKIRGSVQWGKTHHERSGRQISLVDRGFKLTWKYPNICWRKPPTSSISFLLIYQILDKQMTEAPNFVDYSGDLEEYYLVCSKYHKSRIRLQVSHLLYTMSEHIVNRKSLNNIWYIFRNEPKYLKEYFDQTEISIHLGL